MDEEKKSDHKKEEEKKPTASEKDEEFRLARRKALTNLVPAVIGAISQAEKVVSPVASPMTIVGRAASQYDALITKRISSYQKLLKERLPRVSNQAVTLEGQNGFSILLDRDSVLTGLIEEYVKWFCVEERWFDFPFSVLPGVGISESLEGVDARLSLPRGSINIRLLRQKPKPSSLPQLQARASKAGSSETWLIVTSGMEKSEEQDFQMDPLFATEKRFLPGRIVVLGLNSVVTERLRDEKFAVRTETTQDGRVKVAFTQLD